MDGIPTGNSSETVRQYFNYLYSQYFTHTTQNYYIHWDMVLWIFFWIFMLAALYFSYTRWQHLAQSKNEPHPVESYNGYIQETNGPVGRFLTIFFVVMFLWLVAVTVNNITHGQVY